LAESANAGHVVANRLHRFVEYLLPPASDEHIGPLFDEQFRRLECHAARSTRDDRNLALKLSHDFSFLDRIRSNRMRYKINPHPIGVKLFRFNRIRFI
jgi:hypothetical protein